MNYKGVIIEESLDDKSVLDSVKILSTKTEDVTPQHKTPWVKQWNLHTVEIEKNDAEELAQRISESLDKKHEWYADFKNERFHFVIYRRKVFKVDLQNPILYKDAKEYGISIGIPEYQVDFTPKDKVWER